MTVYEKQIVDGLLSHDERTMNLFFVQSRPLLTSVAREVFIENMNYETLIHSFHSYLLANDGAVLRRYINENNKNTLLKWLRCISQEYFIKLKEALDIDAYTKMPLYHVDLDKPTAIEKMKKELDIAAMLDMIELERDRLVIEKIDIEGVSYDELAAQTGLSKANLYNIRKRALDRLKKKARIALSNADSLCAIRCEQYVLDMFGIHRPIFELKRLAEEKGWLTDNGIAIEDLGKIPDYYGLGVHISNSNINAIATSIESGRQVLVAVDGGELIGNPFEEKMEDVLIGGIADHCVVVLNYDNESESIMLFNPAFGDIPLTVSTEAFLDAWEDSGNYTVEISKQK